MYLSVEEAKKMVCDIGRKMYMKGIVTSNAGNITVRCGEHQVVMTPTNVSKGDLTPDMLLVVDFDGTILEGTSKPTRELDMHLNVYRTNNEMQSTVHAHSLFLSAFATAGIELDLPLSPETVLCAGRIPVTPYYAPGSAGLAEAVIPYVNDHPIITLINHGPIAWGKTPQAAWFIMDGAEKYAQECLLHKYILKSFTPMSKAQIEEIQQIEFRVSDSMLVRGSDEALNHGKAQSLYDMEIDDGITLSEETLDRLADKIAKRLKG